MCSLNIYEEERKYEEVSDHWLRRFYWFQFCLLYAEKILGYPAD